MGKCCSHGMEMVIHVLQHITCVFLHIIKNEIIKIYFPFGHVKRERLIHEVTKYFHVCSPLAKMYITIAGD